MDETKTSPFGNFTISKLTAIFCVLTVILSIVAYGSNDHFAIADAVSIAEQNIENANVKLANLYQEQDKVMEKYGDLSNDVALADQYYEEWQSELSELRALCGESSFHESYWYDCYDCGYKCRSLHESVDEAFEKYDKYADKVEDYKKEVEPIENQIEAVEENIRSLTAEYERLDEVYSKVLYHFFTFLVLCIAMVAFAVYMAMEKSIMYLGLGSAGVGAFASFLMLFSYEFSTFASFIFNPCLWTTVVFWMFVVLVLRQGEEKIVRYRVIAIVMAVFASLFAFWSEVFYTPLALIIAPLFLATMILAAFSFVPIDFKEYIKVAMHIFLSIITFGIWRFVWVYYVTKNLNKVDSLEKRNPVNELLLYMFLPFYAAYWLYKNAEYVEAYGDENGKKVNKISILCFIIGFFSPLLSTILMQDKINQIVGKPE